MQLRSLNKIEQCVLLSIVQLMVTNAKEGEETPEESLGHFPELGKINPLAIAESLAKSINNGIIFILDKEEIKREEVEIEALLAELRSKKSAPAIATDEGFAI